MIGIVAAREGHRRCGIAHTIKLVKYENNHFTEEQLAELKADPAITVFDDLPDNYGKPDVKKRRERSDQRKADLFIMGLLLMIARHKTKGLSQKKIQAFLDKIDVDFPGISLGSTNGRFAEANALVKPLEEEIKKILQGIILQEEQENDSQ